VKERRTGAANSWLACKEPDHAQGHGQAARAWFTRASDSGMSDAQVALAEMMLNGRGGPPSTAAAQELFEKAASKGGAMYALGALHAGGHGMPTNRQIAQHWFRAAAELGHGHAQMMLGRYLINGSAGDLNHQEAQLWLERAVAQGIADAEADLAALASRKPGSSTGEIQNDPFGTNEATNPYRLS